MFQKSSDIFFLPKNPVNSGGTEQSCRPKGVLVVSSERLIEIGIKKRTYTQRKTRKGIYFFVKKVIIILLLPLSLY